MARAAGRRRRSATGSPRILVGALAGAVGLDVDASAAGIISVLVFGAGTNYALLLVARYRDELRRREDRFAAMDRALRTTTPAILASGGTVALSLLTLLLADLTSNRGLGFGGAVGVVTAMVFGLVVLPAALVLPGRWLFWPFVPRVGDPTTAERAGLWSRLGRLVVAAPRRGRRRLAGAARCAVARRARRVDRARARRLVPRDPGGGRRASARSSAPCRPERRSR